MVFDVEKNLGYHGESRTSNPTSSSIQAEISWFLLVDMPIHAICPVFCGRKVQCFDDVIGSSLQDGSTCCQTQWLLTTLRIDLTLHWISNQIWISNATIKWHFEHACTWVKKIYILPASLQLKIATASAVIAIKTITWATSNRCWNKLRNGADIHCIRRGWWCSCANCLCWSLLQWLDTLTLLWWSNLTIKKSRFAASFKSN